MFVRNVLHFSRSEHEHNFLHAVCSINFVHNVSLINANILQNNKRNLTMTITFL
jgi:hypothetical protein